MPTSHETIRELRRAPAMRQTGFTLVELMVASAILGMTVSAVSFMVLNSISLRYSNDHNRQARMIAEEELEDPDEHFLNYSGMGELTNAPIELDHGEGSQAATTAYRNLFGGNVEVFQTIDGVNVPYKMLTSRVNWTENGRAVSVTLCKRVVDVR